MSFDNGFYDPAEEQTETTKEDTEKEEDVKELTDDELKERIKNLENVEHVPEDACDRYEVCGNRSPASGACGECWNDVLEQLDFPGHAGRCPECNHRYWKFIPAGKVCILRCKDCGYKEEQTIEYTGEEDLDPREQAMRDFQTE